jgi:transposase
MPIEEDGASRAVGRRRQSWTGDEKRRIVDESLAAGASIAEVARRHDLNANQLFTWRRQLGGQQFVQHELAPILPVTIEPEIPTPENGVCVTTSQMEIVLAECDRIIVWSDVEVAALSRVLKALSRR